MDYSKVIQEYIKPNFYNTLKLLNRYGFIPGGHNGPYYDQETPVRNTANFAISAAIFYKMTGDENLISALEKSGKFLLSKSAIPFDGIFYCRMNINKDLSNGLIGQSWAIDGLMAIYDVLKEDKYINRAVEIFNNIPFDYKNKLWKTKNVDGSIKDFDIAFNHQLWFAATGTEILKYSSNEDIKKKIASFFSTINKRTRVHKNGLIKHNIAINNRSHFFKIITLIKNHRRDKNMEYKENGYHLFNVYAFARIINNGVKLVFFNSKKFKKIFDYCFSDLLLNELLSNKIERDNNKCKRVVNNKYNIYGFLYNVSGFEAPYIYYSFCDLNGKRGVSPEKLLETQLDITYNCKNKDFSLNNDDYLTMNTRIYELLKLYEIRNQLDDIKC